MNLKTTRKVILGMWIALILLTVLGVLADRNIALTFAYLILADMIGIIVIAGIFQRCPHCGEFLRAYGKFCSHCGKELDW